MEKHKYLISFFFVVFFLTCACGAACAENISSQSNFEKNLILILFKKSSEIIPASFLNNFANEYSLSYDPEENSSKESGYFIFETKTGEPIQDKINSLKKDSRVKNAQPNFIFHSADVPVKKNQTLLKTKNKSSQDRFFDEEWWIYNNGTWGTPSSDIYLLNVWNQEQANWPAIPIGIIDSGINQKHADLKKNVIRGYDFVHGRKKKMRDKEGHGSFIAGLIASAVNNRKGIAGLSRLNRLKVVSLKFDFSTDEAISAIAMAQARGIRILNMSWGTEEYDSALYEAIKAYNGLVVAAAGNEGMEHNQDNHFYPCDFDLDNVICVGASSEDDQITTYSDYGESVDILAPGGENVPLISLDTKTNHYTEGMGTSFSAALVSGAAGLVLSANPSISNSEIKNLILNNARKKEELVDKIVSGGMLNVKAAVNREFVTQ